jgi:hypothetical protein
MFDLEREVAAWSAAVHAQRCRPAAAGVAELTDHLYCEIDRGRAAGLSDEEAFRAAIARLGSIPELTAEHAKNRSALGTAWQAAATADCAGSRPDRRRLLLAHALIWAALIIACSLMLTKTEVPEVASLLLTLVFVPLWWVSDRLMRLALRQGPAGGA